MGNEWWVGEDAGLPIVSHNFRRPYVSLGRICWQSCITKSKKPMAPYLRVTQTLYLMCGPADRVHLFQWKWVVLGGGCRSIYRFPWLNDALWVYGPGLIIVLYHCSLNHPYHCTPESLRHCPLFWAQATVRAHHSHGKWVMSWGRWMSTHCVPWFQKVLWKFGQDMLAVLCH